MEPNTYPAPGLIRAWANAHETTDQAEARLYLEGTTCTCCGVDLAPDAEVPALAAVDLPRLPAGGIDRTALTEQDAVTFGILADWGIWPDDHTPHADRELGESFALQIGAGEAVEHWEVLGLIRAVAHQAYRAGFTSASL